MTNKKDFYYEDSDVLYKDKWMGIVSYKDDNVFFGRNDNKVTYVHYTDIFKVEDERSND